MYELLTALLKLEQQSGRFRNMCLWRNINLELNCSKT